MAEKTTIKKFGSSAGILLDKGALKVYGLEIGSEIEIDYKFPIIVIKKIPKEKKATQSKKTP